jgi:hypothetical protein
VRTDLTLMNEALLVWMDELDRILDGDDVQAARVVDQIDDRRQRGRFSGAGRPGDSTNPLRIEAMRRT